MAAVAAASVSACAAGRRCVRVGKSRRASASSSSSRNALRRTGVKASGASPSPSPSSSSSSPQVPPRQISTAAAAAAAAPMPPEVENLEKLLETTQPSGLDGKALRLTGREFPSLKEVMDAIPEECFVRDTGKSMMYAAISTALTIGCGVAAATFIPFTAAAWPLWLAYAVVNGTLATGCWVIAHECGHNAFSDNKFLQDTVGYILHSALLVPYFSWQRSHAIHHSKTNHLTEGETHVPYIYNSPKGKSKVELKGKIGTPYGIFRMISHLVFGWPAYLISGATGGPVRGTTNHFVPGKPFSDALFPTKQWKAKVWLSDVGVVAVLAGLYAASQQFGFWPVFALYWGPYMFTNVWLVLYTWLQHTDTDVPHFDKNNWSFIKGALMTIDRPYGPVLDFVHHRIGSTHVAHHVNCNIPHYNAVKATNAIKEKFPDFYLYDPTPIHEATWRVASQCIAVTKRGDMWVFKRPAK